MSHVFGEGELGEIVYGSRRYQLTWNDLLWAGRMLTGESGRDIQDMKNVLWSMTQLLAEHNRSNFASMIQNYSQPINPRWRRDGEFCQPGGRWSADESRCGAAQLDRRDSLANKPWDQISSDIQDVIYNWATAKTNNPIPKASEFATPAAASHSNGAVGLASREQNLEIVYDALNRGPDSIENHGNVFYSTRNTRMWDNNYVQIQFRGETTTETVPSSSSSTSRTESSTSRTTTSSELSGTFDRSIAMTQNRTTVPSADYAYYILPSNFSDPATNNRLTEAEEDIVIKTNHDRFYRQVNGLKSSETFDYAKILPLITIWGEDESGAIVNLTELIFSQPTLHNIFEDGDAFNQFTNAEFPDRPLASIESLTIDVQQPSVGGTSEITILNLKLKIHSPSIVDRNHPKGKFISYMMRPGYNIRIRYGVTSEDNVDIEAFQWKEQGFFTSQYSMTVNDDKTIELQLQMLPNTQKLMNQVLIGESIPVSQLGQITNQDIDNVLNSITTNGDTLSQQQVDEIRRRLQNFQNQFNQTAQVVALRTESTGNDTFGSTLHGAITNSRILERSGLDATSVVVDNTVEALTSIQSILLTRRFDRIMQTDAYHFTLPNGSPISAVNCGPLIYNLVRPEIEMIVQYAANNNLQIGEVFSDDYRIEQSSQRRNNVTFIFGNFNGQAGQYANKPISAFPINLDFIFSYLRRRRLLGEFSNNLNGFINNIASIIHDPTNYTPERHAVRGSPGSDESTLPIEFPQIKYLFYPDPRPERSDNWIFYIYDNKVPIVEFRSFLDQLNGDVTPTKEQIIEACIARHIPWIEMGTEGNFVKTMAANTQGDDMIQSRNIVMANRSSMGQRHADASAAPSGVFSDWWNNGETATSERIDPITQQTITIPFQVRATTFMLSSAFLFAPIYIFFPIPEFSGIFIPQQLGHSISSGQALTNMNLNFQLTRANRRAS